MLTSSHQFAPTGSIIVISRYRKIPKISAEAYIFQRPVLRGLFLVGLIFRRGLSTEGNLRFKIDWASLIVAGKFTVFALFHFVFEGNFPSTNLRGAYIWRGDLTEGFLRSRFGGLIYMEGLIFGILYANDSHNCTKFSFCDVVTSLL